MTYLPQTQILTLSELYEIDDDDQEINKPSTVIEEKQDYNDEQSTPTPTYSQKNSIGAWSLRCDAFRG